MDLWQSAVEFAADFNHWTAVSDTLTQGCTGPFDDEEEDEEDDDDVCEAR